MFFERSVDTALHEPTFSYRLGGLDHQTCDVRRGKLRNIRHQGRAGILLDDVHGAVALGPHNLNEPIGSIGFWVLPMEDLHTSQRLDHHNLNVADADEFTLLSDRETVKDSRASHFSIVWSSYWHPSFFVKRFPGHIYQAYREPQKAAATAGHFSWNGGQWYHVGYSWNLPKNRHRLYVNGILAGVEDRWHKGSLQTSHAAGTLFFGSSMFALGDVTGFSSEVEEWTPQLAAENANFNPSIQTKLRATYLGEGIAPLHLPVDNGWETALELPFESPRDLERFQIQGCAQAPMIEERGLRITTPLQDPAHDFSILDLNHVYLWSRDWFEGNLHISYEFQNLRRGGLSLLMAQCSGMQREDFWKSHRPRSNGIMKTVCWEDVRNYHWEYLREMDDVRNDVASHALLKNPWHRALGFRVHGPLYPQETWLRLDFLQTGGRIQCAINGQAILDVEDRADQNNGPVLTAGRFAIRCMTRTDILIRNLSVRTRTLWYD